MENEKKRVYFRFLNLFDLIALLVILGLAAVLAVIILVKEATKEVVPVHYTMELTEMENGTAWLIQPGDILYEASTDQELGEVVSVEVTKTKRQVQDLTTGTYRDSEMETRETATVVVLADCTEDARSIKIDDEFAIRVGMSITVCGSGYIGGGFIIGVERIDSE